MYINDKLKAFVFGLAIVIATLGFSGKAYAQQWVIDTNAITQDHRQFIETQTHYGSQISHYAEQIKKYEEQIKQLQNQYDAISGIKFGDILELGLQGEDARIRLGHALEGKGKTFGLGLPDSQTADMKAYHESYRFLQPEELHPENQELQKEVRELQKTLFALDSITGETRFAREKRLEVYTALADKSASAEDIKGALEVNNALLLENGRNLALLIELQTAQLAAESEGLREKVRSRQSVASVFGSTGDGF